MSKFYITNAIPYVNAKPHIGHALEFIYSDVLARYHSLLKENVVLSCGYDENSLKNVQAAEAEKISVQELVNKNGILFHDLWVKLSGKKFDNFTKGSDPRHIKSSQKLWELCQKNGDIYEKSYTGLYCVGCEQFYTPDELDANGECFEHPGKKLETVEEKNYFFRLSKYQNKILELIESDDPEKRLEIVPEFRKNEVIAFVKKGLEDISISRSNERAKNWGVPVPGDNSQRMYVWFDALNIYQTSVGFGWDEKLYDKWWPADIHVIGKGIVRFHAVYWPAFLLSAKLQTPKKLFVHEYFTVGGQKMSKSLGNVYDPMPFLEKHGADALRYFCLAKISPFQDGDFSEDKVFEAYNTDLANGIGNLVARVAKLCEKNNIEIPNRHSGKRETSASRISTSLRDAGQASMTELYPDVKKYLDAFHFNEALGVVWQEITKADQKINKEKPWELSKEKAKPVLEELVSSIQKIAYNLKPFLPQTAEKIEEQFKGPKIKAEKPLFPRM